MCRTWDAVGELVCGRLVRRDCECGDGGSMGLLHQLSCYTTSNMWTSHHPVVRPASWRCPVTGECQFIQILCLSSADSLSFHTWKSDFNSAVKIMSLLSHLRSSRVEETGHRFTLKHWMWCRDASACNIRHKTRCQRLTLRLMRPYVETFKTFMTSVEIIFLLAADCRVHITPSCIQPIWKLWRSDRRSDRF